MNKNQDKDPKRFATKVVCPHCGKEFDAEVEVPQASAPKIEQKSS